MDDARDHRRPRPVPAHVRAITSTPVHVEPESSEAIEDPEVRRAYRESQPSDSRIGRLEDKHDGLAKVVNGIHVAVGHMSGQVATLVDLTARAHELANREASAEQVRAMAIIEAADRQAARRHKFSLAALGIVVPLVTALGLWRLFQ